MHQRSSIALYKLLRRHPFLSKSLASISTQTFQRTCSASKTTISSNPSSNFPQFNHPTFSICNLRNYSGDPSGEFDKNKIVDEINYKFAEAREEIEAAMESKETVYFDEEAECARVAVNQVLDMFEGLLGKLEGKEKEALQRSMGLKIEQLKAELQQLDE